MSFPLSGQLCDIPPAPRSPCEGTECQNGANCVNQGSRPVCQCLPGFGGPECEKLLSVNFVDRDTYLQFTDLQNWPRANITLQVCVWGPGHSKGVREQGIPAPQNVRLHPRPQEPKGTCVERCYPRVRMSHLGDNSDRIQKTKLARGLAHRP